MAQILDLSLRSYQRLIFRENQSKINVSLFVLRRFWQIHIFDGSCPALWLLSISDTILTSFREKKSEYNRFSRYLNINSKHFSPFAMLKVKLGFILPKFI
ncbi:hypothetical protein ACU8KH_03316 [Lachancea thermotolerans]